MSKEKINKRRRVRKFDVRSKVTQELQKIGVGHILTYPPYGFNKCSNDTNGDNSDSNNNDNNNNNGNKNGN